MGDEGAMKGMREEEEEEEEEEDECLCVPEDSSGSLQTFLNKEQPIR